MKKSSSSSSAKKASTKSSDIRLFFSKNSQSSQSSDSTDSPMTPLEETKSVPPSPKNQNNKAASVSPAKKASPAAAPTSSRKRKQPPVDEDYVEEISSDDEQTKRRSKRLVITRSSPRNKEPLAKEPAPKRRRRVVDSDDEEESDDDEESVINKIAETKKRRLSTPDKSKQQSSPMKSKSTTPTKASTSAAQSASKSPSSTTTSSRKKSLTPIKQDVPSTSAAVSSSSGTTTVAKSEPKTVTPYVPIQVPKRPPPVSQLWVDKYQPKTLDDLMGNKAGITELKNWLTTWEEKYRNNKAEAPKGRKKTEETRSAIISGVPGIGKTSAVRLVCQACGYEVKELNASDTRSKKSLIEEIGELVSNRAIGEFFSSAAKKQNKKKICIIMDEVDGMSSGDRGGVAELVKLIKGTRVPIICICNDRSKPALKTLISTSLDIKFTRPVKTTIIKKMQQICALEKVKVEATTLDLLVTSLGNDIRSILNNLQLLGNRGTAISYNSTKNEQIEKSSAQQSIFDDIGSMLGGGSKSYEHLLGLYFNDTTLVPLFVQENYIRMRPADANPESRMSRIALAADSISMADLVNAKIYSTQQFQLATVHADFSCIRPSHFVRGKFEALSGYDRYYQFPACLGKMSTTNKNLGILRSVQKATGVAASGNNVDMLDYMPVWRDRMLAPLIKNGSEGISDTIDMIDEYGLTKDDLMNISELSSFKGKLSEDMYLKKVATATKTAFTRAYNKSHKGFSKASSAKKSDNCMTLEDMTGGTDDQLGEEADENELVDEYITKQKLNAKRAKFDKKQAAAAKKAKTSSTKASSSGTSTRKKAETTKKPLQLKKK